MSTLNARIQLRRDNDYNYNSRPNFKPLAGEVCLVDVVGEGLKVKVGDGVTLYRNLDWYYPSDLLGTTKLYLGYYYNGEFYEDVTHIHPIDADSRNLYIDKDKSNIYYYFANAYHSTSAEIVPASAVTAGILKLYPTTGQNTDGTMTQKAITDGLEELKLSVDDETLITKY